MADTKLRRVEYVTERILGAIVKGVCEKLKGGWR